MGLENSQVNTFLPQCRAAGPVQLLCPQKYQIVCMTRKNNGFDDDIKLPKTVYHKWQS